MGWSSYEDFMDGMTRLMECLLILFELHTQMIFSAPSLLAVGHVMKDIFGLRSWRGNLFLIWLAVSSVWELRLQMVMSATGGYMQPPTMGFTMPHSTVLSHNDSALNGYFSVSAGVSIGLNNRTLVDGPAVAIYNNIQHN